MAKLTKAEKRQRQLENNAFLMARTFKDARGQFRCKRHGKVHYGSRDEAHAGLIEYLRHPESDPGAVTYGCQYTRGFHIGHPGGWKSLGRLMNEAEGIYRMEDAG